MRVDLASVTIRLGGTPIVQDIDLSVPEGAFLAIVGPNGSGKTTLLRAIYQAVRPVGGAVLIGRRDVRAVPPREAARLRAVVPQFQDAGTGLTASEVVGTGRHAHVRWWSAERPADRDLVTEALRRTGAGPLAQRVFSTLSGGERQRVLLARALAQEASVLILDEPTNHLDPRAQLDLLDLLGSLPLTRIAVFHDLDHALAYADLVAVLHSGRLVASGPPAEVLTDDLTTTVFGVRSQLMQHPLTGRPHLLTAPLPGTPTAEGH
ncbi:ABC transporter ATP-binding protein [Amycolatopsis jejuensis]|uniref:ABC transporter ATP-binding protein n=1 Tax=Amycolatopsis jejuensis TaxID=330084 RepID=UPI0005278C1F|nr:ABC transporter ATP-binding protein [Amycolatopsis jejuensis]